MRKKQRNKIKTETEESRRKLKESGVKPEKTKGMSNGYWERKVLRDRWLDTDTILKINGQEE